MEQNSKTAENMDAQTYPLPKKQQVDRVKHVIAVYSAKGGVGKSTLSVNLAFALQRLGYKVGLLDADIYGPSIPTMLGVNERPEPDVMGRIKPVMAHKMPIMSIGFMVEDEQPLVWRGPVLFQVLQQFFHEVRWTGYDEMLDYLIIDLPPGTGDIQLSMAQQVEVTGSVIVTTPQDVALQDVRRGISLFNIAHVPILGVVENMSYFRCGHCGERTDIFSTGGAQSVADKSGVPLLGEVPLVPAIRECGDNGLPIVLEQPESEHAKRYMEIAEKLVARVVAQESAEASA
ncbi:MRP ATP/GTP-binding protein [Magnetococcus marinus MC-1]|uniref:Iron-sulfur cluster carrier protein n=1 Tax=Magnetococcus marinus (strain ATCC BAA-1437 / JCM 17883 / MC-1) TaxID=156889 RepID=A0L8B8_MAGMM|nr:Mrp/NBP35 family ATP-binding protein [Magnetococcus marinus]ABK44211.1 MRP ATP/GTP-binding protein [Magnetococcus marinus MC-1]